MKAIVIEHPGGPEVLQLKEIPTPEPRSGWVLIKIKAFGLNRSEMYTRQGHSGDAVPFPRVLQGLRTMHLGMPEALHRDRNGGQSGHGIHKDPDRQLLGSPWL